MESVAMVYRTATDSSSMMSISLNLGTADSKGDKVP